MKCTCGNEAKPTATYRITPHGVVARYLRQYKCPKCGDFVCNHYNEFIRMGRIDDNGDDSHITGGSWL